MTALATRIRAVNQCINLHGIPINCRSVRVQPHTKAQMRIYCCKSLDTNSFCNEINGKIVVHFVFFFYRADYIAWNGANSELCKGSRSLAKGTDPSLRSSRLIQAQGTKSELWKGPNASLAKGSIYAQLKMQQVTNVKCN